MDLIPREADRIRIENWDNDIFSDIDISNGQYVLEFQFYEMHNLQLREKNGAFKMFIIPNDWNISDVDFGYFEDAEIVWQNCRKSE